MSKAKLFSEQNKVGSDITLFLSGGREITGQIESITDDCVLLYNGTNHLTFFFEMIGGWGLATNQVISDGPKSSQINKKEIDTKPSILDPSIFEIIKSKPSIILPDPNFKIDHLVTDNSQ
jgi:hypothetical protein